MFDSTFDISQVVNFENANRNVDVKEVSFDFFLKRKKIAI